MDSKNYINKELSWLAFNSRILQEADRPSNPPLERLKFIGIWRSNLDEFIQVRVGALIHKKKINPDYTDPINGETRDQLLMEITNEISEQQEDACYFYNKIISAIGPLSVPIGSPRPSITVLQPTDRFGDLEGFENYYQKLRTLLDIFVIRKDDPMPFIDSGKTYLIAHLSNKKDFFGIIDLTRLPTFFNFMAKESTLIQTIADAPLFITQFVHRIFKNYTVNAIYQFRILRNADIMLSSEICKGNERFQKFIKKMVHHRKFMRPICLEVIPTGEPCSFDAATYSFLLNRFNLTEKGMSISKIPFNIDFSKLIRDPNAEKLLPLINEPWEHINREKRLSRHNNLLFDLIYGVRKEEGSDYPKTLMLHFPYDSMNTLINLIYEASNRHDCISIKITLYRMAQNSRIAAALAYAASRGKEVICLLELRARFNESSNVDYSEYFEKSGCKVFYGLPDYKVHGKMCLIEGQNWTVSAVGTGNFNEKTAELYSDLLYIKSEPKMSGKMIGMGDELKTLFTNLCSGIENGSLTFVLSGPNKIKLHLLRLMDKERDLGKDGYICLKVNGLDDHDIIYKIIECDRAGVRIDLIVRGICCLTTSNLKNTRIISVIGRYLEHSRIFWFGKELSWSSVYIGSADLRTRNLDHRIEILARVTDLKSKHMLKRLLDIQLDLSNDHYQMLSDGTYQHQGFNDTQKVIQDCMDIYDFGE